MYSYISDVSLPAVFLPSKSTNLHIYNPRANKYFHPTGAGGARLAQPPSMLTLPPLPKSVSFFQQNWVGYCTYYNFGRRSLSRDKKVMWSMTREIPSSPVTNANWIWFGNPMADDKMSKQKSTDIRYLGSYMVDLSEICENYIKSYWMVQLLNLDNLIWFT